METRRSSFLILLFFSLLATVAFIFAKSGFLKTQLLTPQEQLAVVKLIRQETDPVTFDIFYERVLEENSPDIGIALIKGISYDGKRFFNSTAFLKQVILNTGEFELNQGLSSQTILIRNMKKLQNTKLGTIITMIPKDQYISLEYDIITEISRKTVIDRPVPVDFPTGFFPFRNPGNDLLYVKTPDSHAILAQNELFLSKTEKVSLGVVLAENQMTTIQPISQLSRSAFGKLPSREPPRLSIDQGEILLPQIPRNDFNALIVRYRFGKNPWRTQSFYLLTTSEITLPLQPLYLPDFFSEIEYSFAFLGKGFHTQNIEFPYQSLLLDSTAPVFYRTAYQSLMPEILKLRDALSFEAEVTIANSPKTIAIGLVLSERQLTLSDIVVQLRQKMPIFLFEDGTAAMNVLVSPPNQIPFLHLVGNLDQIWIQKFDKPKISAPFPQLERIPVPDPNPAITPISKVLGDELLCLLKTKEKAYSIPVTTSGYVAFSGDCLVFAKRAGFDEGKIYPIRYDSQKNMLEALPPYSFTTRLLDKPPKIQNINTSEKTISLTSPYASGTVKLLVSADPFFTTVSVLPLESSKSNAFKIPQIPACKDSCYGRLAAAKDPVAQVSDEVFLLSENVYPQLQFCFSNLSVLEKVLNPEDLSVSLIPQKGDPVPVSYDEVSRCFKALLNEQGKPVSKEAAKTIDAGLAGAGKFIRPWELFAKTSPEFPPKTLVFHLNGFSNNHLVVPPQRHYLTLQTDSFYQVLLSDLVFEHYQLSFGQNKKIPPVLSSSYQLSFLGKTASFFPVLRGNIILQERSKDPVLFQVFENISPLNETILFPGKTHPLAIPNTIRTLSPDAVVLQPFLENSQTMTLAIPIPEGTSSKLFLEKLFRPEITIRDLEKGGVFIDLKTSFAELKNVPEMLSLPLVIQRDLASDAASYKKTFPETPVPVDFGIMNIPIRLAFERTPLSDLPNTTIERPFDLSVLVPGKDFEEKILRNAMTIITGVEFGQGIFLSPDCQSALKFNGTTRAISGKLTITTRASCLFFLPVRFLEKLPFGKLESNTTVVFRIPIQSSATLLSDNTITITVPVSADGKLLSDAIPVPIPVSNVQEMGAVSVPGSESVITALDTLSISFDATRNQFVLSGVAPTLTEPVTRSLRAFHAATGQLLQIKLRFLPVVIKALTISITEGFPYQMDLWKILETVGYTADERKTMRFLETTKINTLEISSDNTTAKLFGLLELQGQVFSFLVKKTPPPASPFLDFDSKLPDDQKPGEKPKIPTDHLISFQVQVKQPETKTFPAISFAPGRQIAIDLQAVAGPGKILLTPQLPDFLKRQGDQLVGLTPDKESDFNLEIKDATSLIVLTLPLRIKSVVESPALPPPPTPSPTPPSTPPPPTANAAPTLCFSDIGDQPETYQKAICAAVERNIILGTSEMFRPTDPINRAELSKILVTGLLQQGGLLSESEVQNLHSGFSESRFFDVQKQEWFFGFVEALLELGIVQGYSDGSFHPNDPVNMAESSKMIVNTLRVLSKVENFSFEPSDGEPWFSVFVDYIRQKGGDFPPPEEVETLSRPVNRAQLLFNVMQVLE